MGRRPSTQPRESGGQAFGFSRFFGMIGARLFHGFGLGLFDERRVLEAAREGIAFLRNGFNGFGDAGAFGFEINRIIQCKDVSRFIDNDLGFATYRDRLRDPCQSANRA